MDFVIRKAKKNDLQLLVTIEQASFDKDIQYDESQFYRALKNIYVACPKTARNLVVGYINVGFPTSAEARRVLSLAVDPDWRGHALGRLLMTALERRLKPPRMYLEVAETNKPAIALYESLGYTIFGRYKDYYDVSADALRMEKTFQKRNKGVHKTAAVV